jgi:hypothetical protein
MRRRAKEQQAAFGLQVEDWVVAQLDTGAVSFDDPLLSLPGVYPTVALDAVNQLASKGRIAPVTANTLRRQARVGPSMRRTPRSLLPLLPHPLDYEWRFTSDGSRRLLDLAADLTQPGDPVLLFGTPGVAFEALSGPLERPIIFLGEDNPVTRRIAALDSATGDAIKESNRSATQ